MLGFRVNAAFELKLHIMLVLKSHGFKYYNINSACVRD